MIQKRILVTLFLFLVSDWANLTKRTTNLGFGTTLEVVKGASDTEWLESHFDFSSGNSGSEIKTGPKRSVRRRDTARVCLKSEEWVCKMFIERKSGKVEQVDDEMFEKPIGCSRNYRYLKLSNSLNVFMVHEKSMDVSFGTMFLNFGFSSDPENYPGLARYVLYAILFGTFKKRAFNNLHSIGMKPGENYFATISRESSNFKLKIYSSELDKALKIFANMFVNLLIDDSVHDEVLDALKADINKYLYSDEFRFSDVIQDLSVKNSEKSSKDRWKFLENLDLKHLEKLKNTKIVGEFFNQYYRAERMTLTIFSNKTLDEQTLLVKRYFSKIKGGDFYRDPGYKFSMFKIGHPFDESKGKILVFRSLQNISILKLFFPLKTFVEPKMNSNILFFLKLYISSRRNGSLYSYLSKKELVRDLKLSLSKSSFNHSSLIIEFYLQKMGKSQIVHILRGVFSVIEMMKNRDPKLELYNKAKALKMDTFKNRQNQSIFSECSKINTAFCALKCSPETVLSAKYTYSNFDLGLHHKILADLRPDNMFLTSTVTPDETKLFQRFDRNSTATDSRDPASFEGFFLQKSFTESQLHFTLTDICKGIEGEQWTCDSCVESLDFKGFDHNILFESTLKSEDVKISGITGTEYVLKNIHHCIPKYLSTSIKPFTAMTDFEIYDPDSKLFRIKDPENFFGGIKEEGNPIRLVEAIKNLGPNYVKIANGDFFKDYQQIFYFPTHWSGVSRSFFSISLNILPSIFKSEGLLQFGPGKLEALFSVTTAILIRILEDLSYYNRKVLTEMNFSFNTPLIHAFYVYGLNIEVNGITSRLSNTISTIASRLRNFGSIVKPSDLELVKEFYSRYCRNNNLFDLPGYQFQYIFKKLLLNQDISGQSICEEIQKVQLNEVISFIDLMVSNGVFEGILCGNINPIKARELLLLFFINLGKTSEESPIETRKTSRLSFISGFFLKIFSSIASSLQFFFNKLFGNLGVPPFTPPLRPRLVKTQEDGTKNSMGNFQVIDLFSINQGLNFVYFERSESSEKTSGSVLFKTCFGYFTYEIDSLVDLTIEVIKRRHISRFNSRDPKSALPTIKKTILLSGVVSIDIHASSKMPIQKLFSQVLMISQKWLSRNNDLSEEDFLEAKKITIAQLKNSNDNFLINLKREIYLKRFQFDFISKKIEFISRMSFSEFNRWLLIHLKRNINIAVVIYPRDLSQKDLIGVVNSTPPTFTLINSTDFFFNLPNARSFIPYFV
ncbi:secreted insulinase-like peptidase [Cryptosporidium felis]|nr:secreted insulinase-like peptidase [Cryptosporidium felis]